MFSRISLDISSHHVVAIVVALVLGVGLAYWSYRWTNPPLPSGLRALLFALRAAALALLVFLLLEPILSLVWRRVEEPMVVLLVDTSASMSISEGQTSRLAQSRAFLEGSLREGIADNNRLAIYQFAEQADPWSRGDSLMADGLATDIAGALETVKRELGDEHLAAVVVLTDGASNLGRNPAHLARTYGLPIFPVGIGSAEPRRDISVKEVLANEVVYVDSRVPLEVTMQSQGVEGLKVPVTLRDGEEVLDSQQITLQGEGREQKVSLEFVPKEVGVWRLTVSIPLQDGELASENNRRDLAVRVLKSKIRVLLVWGAPSWDFSFLRNSLEVDPNVELTPLAAREKGEYFLGAFPQDEVQLRDYDVFVLGDLAPLRLTTQQQEWLHRLVTQQGKGLLLVGGPRFGMDPGSPLAELLPLNLPGRRIATREDEFWVELSAAGRVHPVMTLEEDALDPEQIWQGIPPFLGLNQFGSPKPATTVLAVHPESETGHEKLPAIAVQQSGTGKSLLVATYPLWRWSFMLWGLGKSGQTYDRFWSNAIRWLATREEGKLISVYPESSVFRSGQRIGFQARLYDQSYRPMDRAQVKMQAARKQTPGRVEAEGNLFESGRRDGHYRGELEVLSPGEYVYRAEVYLGGQKVGEDQGQFLVEEYSLEFERMELNEALLRTMAQVSGGTYFHLAEAGGLANLLNFQSRQISGHQEIELWNHPAVLIALVMLLAAEWTLRKKNRLL